MEGEDNFTTVELESFPMALAVSTLPGRRALRRVPPLKARRPCQGLISTLPRNDRIKISSFDGHGIAYLEDTTVNCQSFKRGRCFLKDALSFLHSERLSF